MKILKGTGTALITPFSNNQIDYPSLEKLIEYQIDGGVDFLVSMGTTGESVTLSPDEITEVVAFTKNKIAGRLPLVIGMGGNNTDELCRNIADFDLTGIQAILSSSPAYNKPSQEGIYRHYMALAKSSPIPIIIYNVPGRTCSNILPETLLKLADASPVFTGVKEASGDMSQATQILKDKAPDFVFLSGDDPTALASISLGGEGCISVISNVYPHAFTKMMQLAMAGDFTSATLIHNALFNLHQWLYIDGNPCGIKQALHIKGFCNPDVRLPLVKMSAHHAQHMKKAIDEIDVLLNEINIL